MINDPAFYRRPGGTEGMRLVIRPGRWPKGRENEQELCPECNEYPRARMNHQGKTYWRKACHRCLDKKYKDPSQSRMYNRRGSANTHKKFKESKMKPCTICGFIPKHSAQMDFDHIDGDHFNNEESNRQLICANCHRLKTIEHRDYLKRYSYDNKCDILKVEGLGK